MNVSVDHPLFVALERQTAKNPLLKALIAHPIYETPHNPIGYMIGPEGGFSPEEVIFIQSDNRSGWTCCSLGDLILRAETAALYGISIIRSIRDAHG